MTSVQPPTQTTDHGGAILHDHGLPIAPYAADPSIEVLRRKTQPRARRLRAATAPSLILASVLVLFLALPLVGLLQRALVNGGLADAMHRPIVLEAVRLSLITTVLVLGSR